MNRNAPMTSPELDLLNFIGFLSDLTCTKKYVLTEAPKRGGELMWATRSAPPPQSVYACYEPEISIYSPYKHDL